MAPKVSPSYVAWWIKVHLRDIGMDKDDDKEEKEATKEGSSKEPTSKESLEDDPYQVKNPIHDIQV